MGYEEGGDESDSEGIPKPRKGTIESNVAEDENESGDTPRSGAQPRRREYPARKRILAPGRRLRAERCWWIMGGKGLRGSTRQKGGEFHPQKKVGRAVSHQEPLARRGQFTGQSLERKSHGPP